MLGAIRQWPTIRPWGHPAPWGAFGEASGRPQGHLADTTAPDVPNDTSPHDTSPYDTPQGFCRVLFQTGVLAQLLFKVCACLDISGTQ